MRWYNVSICKSVLDPVNTLFFCSSLSLSLSLSLFASVYIYCWLGRCALTSGTTHPLSFKSLSSKCMWLFLPSFSPFPPPLPSSGLQQQGLLTEMRLVLLKVSSFLTGPFRATVGLLTGRDCTHYLYAYTCIIIAKKVRSNRKKYNYKNSSSKMEETK